MMVDPPSRRTHKASNHSLKRQEHTQTHPDAHGLQHPAYAQALDLADGFGARERAVHDLLRFALTVALRNRRGVEAAQRQVRPNNYSLDDEHCLLVPQEAKSNWALFAMQPLEAGPFFRS